MKYENRTLSQIKNVFTEHHFHPCPLYINSLITEYFNKTTFDTFSYIIRLRCSTHCVKQLKNFSLLIEDKRLVMKSFDFSRRHFRIERVQEYNILSPPRIDSYRRVSRIYIADIEVVARHTETTINIYK